MKKRIKQHGGKRPGAGRKPIPPEQRKSEMISFRVTQSEKALIMSVAGNTQEWIRRVIVAAARRKK